MCLPTPPSWFSQRGISKTTDDHTLKYAFVRAARIQPGFEITSLAWAGASSSKTVATLSLRLQELHLTHFMDLFSEFR